MKEATGELNSTLFAVISIAVLSAFFFTMIWPTIRKSMITNAKCGDAVCEKTPTNGWVDCKYYILDENNNYASTGEVENFKCPYKG